MADFKTSSPTPYLIRAWHEWMQDNGLTPYLLVKVDERVTVPQEHIKDGEIVLNISTEATGSLNLGNTNITFQARFSGKVRDLSFPVDCVVSIFARETGQGMAFDLPDSLDDDMVFGASADAYTYRPASEDASAPAPASGLSVVKKSDAHATQDSKTSSTADKPKRKDDKGGKSSNLRLID